MYMLFIIFPCLQVIETIKLFLMIEMILFNRLNILSNIKLLFSISIKKRVVSELKFREIKCLTYWMIHASE